MKKLISMATLLLLAFSLVLSGCGSNGKSNAPKKEGKDITVGVNGDFVSLDPHDTNDNLSYSAESTMLEGLLSFDKDMKITPILAKSYTASKDAKEITFKLKKGIKFQDGTPFDAKAVKANIDRLADPKSTLKRHSLFSTVKETVIIDDYTVKVTLSKPFGAMVNNFAHPAAMMISPKAIEKYGKDVAKHPVGTGPYSFVSWKPGQYLKVKKNTKYWQKGGAKLDSITFKPIIEDGSRMAKLQSGEADLIYPVPTEQAKKINGQNGIEVDAIPSITATYMSMNTLKKPFNNVKVRQALNYAIDKNAYINVVKNGYSKPLFSAIAPNVQYYEKQTPYNYDVKKAKALLKEAGYPNGFSTTLWGGNSSATMKAMEFLQQQLDKVNVKVKIEPMESGTLATKIWSVNNPKEAGVELYYGSWSPSTGDADWGIRPLLSGSSYPPAAYNTAYYKNEKADKLINQGLMTAVSTERQTAYSELQKQIWQDAPWVFLANDDLLVGKKTYLKNAYLNLDGTLNIAHAEISNK
ncbi:glutathione ABC transporter substrate-binding protein [Terrilactibacillus laevilacticus]|uniref:glutathione ABC transporter substrate-binding protein n=1 Tax=Terrilactibacillus laevilacticus TaxID=1380157 RepID=UPI0011476DAE|nr:glutathione ABC transporter substrate-binding protein [Terrilactibacillus laevilacticus]